MNKLRLQVFGVIFLILTLITTAIFCGYNMVIYNHQYQSVKRCLDQTSHMNISGFGQKKGDFEPDGSAVNRKPENVDDIRFIDFTVYTVKLNSDNTVSEVINHSGDGTSDEDIEKIATAMISQSYQSSIGNLYFADYSYSYLSGEAITIVNNAGTKQTLRNTLLYSLILYFLIEGIIYLAARILTLRITKPVADSFDKQKQFIADASHELKTPLSVIIASADALETNPTEHKWLENIKSESDRMNKLVADLLELAKSEEVADKSEFAAGDLSKVVEKSALTFEGVMFEKGVFLTDDIQSGIEMKMSEYKIQQLIAILLDNAVKHSEKGSTVNIALKKDKDIILTVTNEGEGIPKGEEEKIFERFYRADESRNRNENRYGLGLAIAKNICQLHGGTISAKSENGKTTFKVIFKA
ncbi:MAG: HAMP domain-containing histidine kinase [Eubacterium sp.]|nr:HAMP domain-containing histidine kinase [Eubacterium sp.]